MRTLIALILAASWLLGAAEAEEAAGLRDARQGAIGVVTARRGSCVVVLAGKAGALAVGQELAVRRPTLLVAIAKGKEQVEAWGGWEEVGRVRVRVLRGPRGGLAFITHETARKGIDGKPAPNIRPGDALCLGTTSRPPPKEGGTTDR